MDLVHPRCAGLDVSKRDAKVCVRVAGSGRAGATSTVTTWGSVTNQVLALRDHLIAEQVTLVVMEATGDYWKPFFYLLEDAGIKLSSVASDISGVSGRAMLDALICGQRDPAELAELTKRRLRSKIPALTEALTGRFTDHHAFLARVHLDLIDQHTEAIAAVTARIEVVIEPFRGARDLMVTIPGISVGVADVIIAETGADMSRFPSAGHLASWAGTCPGSNESAGRIKSTKTRPGNPYLKGALGIAAMSAASSKDTYLAAKYLRIASRRGPIKAIVAVEHAMLIAIWNMLTNGVLYDDLGGDFYTRRNPNKTKQRALDQLKQMGYDVTLRPVKTAVAG